MSDYTSALDIGNRALQHCGVTRIGSLTENSKNAAALLFAYDKLRRAELRRNVWRFAIRRVFLRPVDYTTMAITPAAYDLTKSYPAAALVTDAGKSYLSRRAVPVGVQPSASTTYWDLYAGPVTAAPYDSGTAYYAGEIVYTPETSNAVAYLSLQSNNDDDPTTVDDYDPTITYNFGDTVTYTAQVYQSNVELNIGIVPPAAGWELVPAGQPQRRQSRKWIRLSSATLASLVIAYPLGSGPYSEPGSGNIFMLPCGFLREAPQAPKLGNLSFAGASSGLPLNDWLYEGEYLLTTEPRGLALRFVADVADVIRMDSMFCEGLAARIALEVCEELTQSSDKLKNIAALYKNAMGEARTVNGIETGSVQPPVDEFISVRN